MDGSPVGALRYGFTNQKKMEYTNGKVSGVGVQPGGKAVRYLKEGRNAIFMGYDEFMGNVAPETRCRCRRERDGDTGNTE